ncbi:MAG: DNA translocase FtsK [bacterium]|nr:DNA translocase FtsK [bacterium]
MPATDGAGLLWPVVLMLATMAKSTSEASGSGAPARRSSPPAAGSKPPARQPGSDAPDEEPSAFARFYRAYRAEIWALAAFVLALLCALGIYGGVGGLVGTAFRRASGAIFGWGRLLVPPALAATGVLLVSGRSRGERGEPKGEPPEHESEPAEPDRSPAVRILGAGLVMLALAGILHLAAGRPTWGDALGDFEGAGGYVGFAGGGALALLAGLAGAVVILVAVGLLGWLALSGMSLRTVGLGVWRALRRTGPASAALGRLVAGERRRERDSESAGDEPDETIRLSQPPQPAPVAAPVPLPAAAPLSGGPPPTNGGLAGGAADLAASDAAAAPEAAPAPRRRASRPQAAPEPPAELPTEGDDSGQWRRPNLGILKRTPAQEVDGRLIAERGRSLEAALAAHGVEATLADVVVGPTVSRYELVLAEGVKVARITALSRDIAYALASAEVRILAPIPGRQAIGVEVPNPARCTVTLGDILASEGGLGAGHPLDVAIGRDITGQAVMANLGRMPHILIAGATGSGKSSSINSIITTILMRCTPDQVRLILVDPKMVEMRQYANVPHLLTQPVIDPKKAANALGWAVREMERRYELLSRVGCRDITGYNEMYETSLAAGEEAAGEGAPDDEEEALKRLPFIVIVVDELSDLMMVAPREVEDAIWRLAQMARAVGVHLVIATQRPSTNVITGVIKANIPARMALSVSSLTDSRVILDQAGAERLVGHGDMLLLDGTAGTPQRIQGAWVSEEEIRRVTAVWRRQNVRQTEDEPITAEDLATPTLPIGRDSGDPDDDELLEAAMELVVDSQLGSTSMLQRKLRVGFARAGRLMDLLEQRGVVGPSEGSKAREVLMTPQEFAVEQAAAHRNGSTGSASA